jgi:hypothetical protein
VPATEFDLERESRAGFPPFGRVIGNSRIRFARAMSGWLIVAQVG